MEMQPLVRTEDRSSGVMPEDEAILYAQTVPEAIADGDFSQNRREYRAQMRHRAAEQLRLMELRAQSEAEDAAARAEAEAAAAHAEADAATVKLAASRTMQAFGLTKANGGSESLEAEEQVEQMRRSSLREAAQQARRAAAERLEAARRAEAAALADSIARREEREIAEAQASALRQAAQHAEAEVRSHQKIAAQPASSTPGRISYRYRPEVTPEAEYLNRPEMPVAGVEESPFRKQREYIEKRNGGRSSQFRIPAAISEGLQRTTPRPTEMSERFLRRGDHELDESKGRRPAATDESLIGRSSQGSPSGALRGFESRLQAKSVYQEPRLSVAHDAFRLNESREVLPRLEEKKASDTVDGDPAPPRRVVVSSTPYREFLRVTGDSAAAAAPEVVERIPVPRSAESERRSLESPINSKRSQIGGENPPVPEAKTGPDAEQGRWVSPLSLSAADPRFTAPAIRGRNNEPVRQVSVPPIDLSSLQTAKANEQQSPESVHHPESINHRAARNGESATAPLLSANDSTDLAREQRDQWLSGSRQARPRNAEVPRREAPVIDSPRLDLPKDFSGPAWLYPKTPTHLSIESLAGPGIKRGNDLDTDSEPSKAQPANGAADQLRSGVSENALPHSREQLASRWFALNGVFAKTDQGHANERQHAVEKPQNTPLVVVYSLAGGVGKTSLVATLGRALSSLGEKVLLADTTSQGLLPYYFGANELHPGVVRTFSPPNGSNDAPINLISYDFAQREMTQGASEAERHKEVFESLIANSKKTNRLLMDLNLNGGWIVGKMAWMKPTILVPLMADMNSVISLPGIERSLSRLQDAEGNSLSPTYLLNQFDASSPLHLDVREALRKKLSERLLPFTIRRASGVSEALAEGMTIIDYDPGSEVAKDYLGVASWLRNISASTALAVRSMRWVER